MGYLPTLVSPESMTASAPSYIAFATSVTSALVGVGLCIIDSSKCVATIDLLPHFAVAYIILLCILGKSARSVSMPKSPLATITVSAACVISWILSRPSWFSIFAIIFMDDFFLFNIDLRFNISWADLTNDKAMKLTLFFIAKLISFRSFLVIEGKSTLTPGKLTWRLLPRVPPSRTLHLRLSLSFAKTWKLSNPLSILILEPLSTLLIRPL